MPAISSRRRRRRRRQGRQKVVTWDSPDPVGRRRGRFRRPGRFRRHRQGHGRHGASILGGRGRQFAVLSASPDAANQNAWIAAMKTALKDPKYAKLKLDDIVYGNDQSENSYNQAHALGRQISQHQADHGADHGRHRGGREGHAGREAVRQGARSAASACPARWCAYTKNGCAPQFALWSFVDLGYLHLLHRLWLATGQLEGRGRRQSSTPAAWANTPSPRTRSRDKGLRDPDGTVHDLQQGQRRGGLEVNVKRAVGATRPRRPAFGTGP